MRMRKDGRGGGLGSRGGGLGEGIGLLAGVKAGGEPFCVGGGGGGVGEKGEERGVSGNSCREDLGGREDEVRIMEKWRIEMGNGG